MSPMWSADSQSVRISARVLPRFLRSLKNGSGPRAAPHNGVMVTGHTSYLNLSGLPTTKAELAALLRSKEEAREALYFTLTRC